MKVFSFFFQSTAFQFEEKEKAGNEAERGTKNHSLTFFLLVLGLTMTDLNLFVNLSFLLVYWKGVPLLFYFHWDDWYDMSAIVSFSPNGWRKTPYSTPFRDTRISLLQRRFKSVFWANMSTKKIISILCSHSRLFWTVMKQKERPHIHWIFGKRQKTHTKMK